LEPNFSSWPRVKYVWLQYSEIHFRMLQFLLTFFIPSSIKNLCLNMNRYYKILLQKAGTIGNELVLRRTTLLVKILKIRGEN
jgi:hypothetical protein